MPKTPSSPPLARHLWIAALALLFFLTIAGWIAFRLRHEISAQTAIDPAFQLPSPWLLAGLPTATRFDFPLGTENGAMAYNAQPFTQNKHLGDDLNGIGGENSDLGDPIHAVADGCVLLAREGGPGWGKVLIILHAYDEAGRRHYVQSYYGHVQSILVRVGDVVRRGQTVATVGTADGLYLAHLHFEMRQFLTPFIGPGYRKETAGWLNPSEFINSHRGGPDSEVGRVTGDDPKVTQ